ncbi:hypothetical protein [Nocardia wallacei]|uniref:hypothetical protein n=1 Tax=Nocardia wallacei TaxID=480035 RepID=UPI0024564463|nr:hypothetical protein [Nocardia wallacei]
MSSAEVSDLTDLPLPRWPRHDGSYPDGPQVRDHTQLTRLIALGRTWAVMPEPVRTHLRDKHAIVPVPDAPTSRPSSPGHRTADPKPSPTSSAPQYRL